MKPVPASDYLTAGTFPDSFRYTTNSPWCTAAELCGNLDRHKRLTGHLPATALTAAWEFTAEPYAWPFHHMEALDVRGVTPHVIWWPYGEGCLNRINSGQYDDVFRARAREFVEWSYGNRRACVVQLGTEINLDAYHWSGDTAGFEMAHRRIHRIMREEGAELTWVIHFFPEFQGREWNRARWYYPGHEYVDWVTLPYFADPSAGAGLFGDYSACWRMGLAELAEIPGVEAKPLIAELSFREHPTDPNWKAEGYRRAFADVPGWPAGGHLNAWDAYTFMAEPIRRPGPLPKWLPTNGRADLVPAQMGIDSSPAAAAAYHAGVNQPWVSNMARRA